jgi:formyltetrahydrofolate deformylase
MSAPPVATAEPRSTTLLLHCPLRLGLAAVIGDGPDIEWSLHASDEVSRIAVFVSRDPSCLYDILARHMQIVTGRFVEEYPNRIINIHHAFLPAFPGARPYHAACERGVKMVGATSHYVTETLDAGPIIEQDVHRVTHRQSVQDLIRLGRDLEKVVLSRAVWNHIRHKIIVHKGRTVVFD